MNDKVILGRNILIPIGSELSTTPNKIQFGTKHYDLIIGIGKDHTARLIIDEDALKALRDLQPEVTIF